MRSRGTKPSTSVQADRQVPVMTHFSPDERSVAKACRYWPICPPRSSDIRMVADADVTLSASTRAQKAIPRIRISPSCYRCPAFGGRCGLQSLSQANGKREALVDQNFSRPNESTGTFHERKQLVDGTRPIVLYALVMSRPVFSPRGPWTVDTRDSLHIGGHPVGLSQEAAVRRDRRIALFAPTAWRGASPVMLPPRHHT